MNPKISIAVDAKNRAISTLTGMVTVGAEIDVEVTGLPSGIEDWASTDKWVGKSLRFRVVNDAGQDLVRFPLNEKTSAGTDGDQWQVVAATSTTAETYKTYNGTSTAPVDFNTDKLRAEFAGVPFNETREFGIILDSTVDKAQYAVGKIKIRNWAAASTEDPTTLPDWRDTLAELTTAIATVDTKVETATTKAAAAETARAAAVTAQGLAEGARDAALQYKDAAVAAKNAAVVAQGAAVVAQGLAETAQGLAEAAVPKYPKIDATTKHWLVYSGGAWVDTGVVAEGADGEDGADGAAATIAVGTVTTGAAGSSASVTNRGTSTAAILDFDIPRGNPGTTDWDGIEGKPSVFPPETHTHSQYAYAVTTGSLAADSSMDDIIAKVNTLISQLKGN